MRNWNMRAIPIDAGLPPGFQRTYEELKLSFIWFTRNNRCMFSAYLWGIETSNGDVTPPEAEAGFQRTYEELKQDVVPPGANKASGFQRTYEELKLSELIESYLEGKEFSAYLWGIETHRQLNCRLTPGTFLAYLWGIETKHFFRKK